MSEVAAVDIFGELLPELMAANTMPAAELHALQQRRLRRLLEHAVAESPYYRRLLGDRDPDSLTVEMFPVMTKSEMMRAFDELVTDPALDRAGLEAWVADPDNIGRRYLDRYAVFQSSGTTGEAAVVVYDELGLGYFFASVPARRCAPRPLPPAQELELFQARMASGVKAKIAYVIVTSGPMTTYVVTKLTPEVQKHFIDQRIISTSLPVAEIVAELNEFQPECLICYPSTLEILARERLAGRLEVAFEGPTAEICTGGELLTPAAKDLARQAWDIEVQDLYGLTECLALGRSCSAFDGMHLMSDLCYVEVVDEHGNPVPDGTPGAKLLVTNLLNEVQPIIRYEVTDVTGLATEPCGCGWPFPKLLPVAGRTNDILYIDAPGGGYEALSPYRFGFLYLLTNIRRFQLVQTARNDFRLDYVPVGPGTPAPGELEAVVDAELARAGLVGRVDLTLRKVADIPLNARSGKLRQITTLVGSPEGTRQGS